MLLSRQRSGTTYVYKFPAISIGHRGAKIRKNILYKFLRKDVWACLPVRAEGLSILSLKNLTRGTSMV